MAQGMVVSQEAEIQKEVFSIREFTYQLRNKSAIDPERIVNSGMLLICPRCSFVQECPPYGKMNKCPECGLINHNHGDELVCYF